MSEVLFGCIKVTTRESCPTTRRVDDFAYANKNHRRRQCAIKDWRRRARKPNLSLRGPRLCDVPVEENAIEPQKLKARMIKLQTLSLHGLQKKLLHQIFLLVTPLASFQGMTAQFQRSCILNTIPSSSTRTEVLLWTMFLIMSILVKLQYLHPDTTRVAIEATGRTNITDKLFISARVDHKPNFGEFTTMNILK